MRTKTRVSIRTECDEVLIIKTICSKTRSWCAECQAWMLPAEQAAIVTNITARLVYKLLESGHVHFAEKTSGSLLICLSSLSTNAQGAEPASSP